MGFPDKALAPGERLEVHLHPHWITVAGPAALGLVLVAAGVAAVVLTPSSQTGDVAQWVALGVVLVAGIWLVAVPFLRRGTTHYVITSRRVMVRRGVLTRFGKDITLPKITDVSYEQTLLDRIVGAGTLRIESAGDSPDEVLRDLPDSHEVQQLLNLLIDEAQMDRAGD